MTRTNKIELKVDGLKQATELYNLAVTAKGEVLVEQGQWSVSLNSPLGFFSMCAYAKDNKIEIISDDADFLEKASRV